MAARVFGCFSGWFGPTVPEAFTKPGQLYSNKNDRIDYKKLRKLIEEGRLAPIIPGAEDSHPPPPNHELYAATVFKVLRKKKVDTTERAVAAQLQLEYEACPICMLHYPALNTSRCCTKRICTECYLQVQTVRSSVPACPFCKLPGFSTRFVGLKPSEEREQERVEEQKLMEARIREREEEVRRDQEREEQRVAQRVAAAAAAQQQVSSGGAAASAAITAAAAADATTAPAAVATAPDTIAAVAVGTPRAQAVSGSGPMASGPVVIAAAGESPQTGGTRSPANATSRRGGVGGTSAWHHPIDPAAVTSPPNAQVVSLAQLDARALAAAQQLMEQEAAAQHQQRRSAAAAAVAVPAAGRTGSPQQQLPNRQASPSGTDQRGAPAQAGAAPGGAGGYRLADYVPTGVVNMALDVEDINEFMLEQAMYESLTAAAAAGAAAGAPPLVDSPAPASPAAAPLPLLQQQQQARVDTHTRISAPGTTSAGALASSGNTAAGNANTIVAANLAPAAAPTLILEEEEEWGGTPEVAAVAHADAANAANARQAPAAAGAGGVSAGSQLRVGVRTGRLSASNVPTASGEAAAASSGSSSGHASATSARRQSDTGLLTTHHNAQQQQGRSPFAMAPGAGANSPQSPSMQGQTGGLAAVAMAPAAAAVTGTRHFASSGSMSSCLSTTQQQAWLAGSPAGTPAPAPEHMSEEQQLELAIHLSLAMSQPSSGPAADDAALTTACTSAIGRSPSAALRITPLPAAPPCNSHGTGTGGAPSPGRTGAGGVVVGGGGVAVRTGSAASLGARTTCSAVSSAGSPSHAAPTVPGTVCSDDDEGEGEELASCSHTGSSTTGGRVHSVRSAMQPLRGGSPSATNATVVAISLGRTSSLRPMVLVRPPSPGAGSPRPLSPPTGAAASPVLSSRSAAATAAVPTTPESAFSPTMPLPPAGYMHTSNPDMGAAAALTFATPRALDGQPAASQKQQQQQHGGVPLTEGVAAVTPHGSLGLLDTPASFPAALPTPGPSPFLRHLPPLPQHDAASMPAPPAAASNTARPWRRSEGQVSLHSGGTSSHTTATSAAAAAALAASGGVSSLLHWHTVNPNPMYDVSLPSSANNSVRSESDHPPSHDSAQLPPGMLRSGAAAATVGNSLLPSRSQLPSLGDSGAALLILTPAAAAASTGAAQASRVAPSGAARMNVAGGGGGAAAAGVAAGGAGSRLARGSSSNARGVPAAAVASLSARGPPPLLPQAPPLDVPLSALPSAPAKEAPSPGTGQTPRQASVAALAAAATQHQPQATHLGMVFVVWGEEALRLMAPAGEPAGTGVGGSGGGGSGGGGSPSLATASAALPQVEASLVAGPAPAARPHPPSLVVVNPDGSVCSVAPVPVTPALAAPALQQQQQQQQRQRAEAVARMAAERLHVADAEYGVQPEEAYLVPEDEPYQDYEMTSSPDGATLSTIMANGGAGGGAGVRSVRGRPAPPEQTRGHLDMQADGKVVRSIAERDAKLMAAYRWQQQRRP